MTNKSHLAAGRALYAAATKQRMARAIGELLAILRAEAGEMQWVLRHVRAQEKASRREGFHGISRLCQEMEDCAGDVGRRDDHTWSSAVAATLLDACRTIQLHADGVLKGAIYCRAQHVRPSKDARNLHCQAVEDDAEPDSSARPPPREVRHVHWRLAGQAATPGKEALSATEASRV